MTLQHDALPLDSNYATGLLFKNLQIDELELMTGDHSSIGGNFRIDRIISARAAIESAKREKKYASFGRPNRHRPRRALINVAAPQFCLLLICSVICDPCNYEIVVNKAHESLYPP
jgi:hypothetical protein